MEDQLISSETAKLAKEKGFNIPTQRCYINDILFVNFEDSHGNEREYFFSANDFYENWNMKDWFVDKEGNRCFGCKLDNKKWFEAYSAPTQSLLQKWLRDNHDLHIQLHFDAKVKLWEARIFLLKEYINPNQNKVLIQFIKCSDYEDALEIGLQKALKLIKS